MDAKLVQSEASITSIAEEEEEEEDASEERASVIMVPRTVFERVRLYMPIFGMGDASSHSNPGPCLSAVR